MTHRALPVVATILLGGCLVPSPPTMPPPAAMRDPILDQRPVQRVLLLPLVDESGHGPGGAVVSEAVHEEMAKTRRFKVVRPDPNDAAQLASRGPRRNGRIPVSVLVDLGKRYGVDGVLFGAITRYRAYPPPVVGLDLILLDVQTGSVLFSVEDLVDGADRLAANSMDAFYRDEAARGETLFGPEIVRTSPDWFARFAARRVVRVLAP